MHNSIKDSFFLTHIFNFLSLIQKMFEESYIYGLFLKISRRFSIFVSNSKLWTAFYTRDSIDEFWRNSFFVKLLNTIFNFPIKLLRKLYIKFEDAFEHSILFKFLHLLADHIAIVIGLALIFTMMIPDHYWYNVYSVIIVGLLSLLFLFKAAVNSNFRFRFEDLDFAFMIFMISIILSAILSLFPRLSLNNLVFYIITFLAVLIITSSIDSTDDLNKLIEFIAIGAFLTALYGIYQWKIVGIEVNPSLTDISVNQGMSGRVFSTMGNPNIYGELLVLTMPFFIVGFLNTKSIFKKLVYTGSFLITTVILLKTGSRSAWVAFAGVIGLFVFFRNKKLLIPMILLGFLAIPFLPASIYNRLLTIFNPNDSSLQYRKEILNPTKPMLKEYWFTGVGLGTEVFNIIYKRYKSFTLKTVAHTHNLFLQIWLESGLIALVSLLWLGFRLIKKVVYMIRNTYDKRLQNIAIGALAGVGGLMVMGFADHVWFYNRILFIFWINISLIFTAIKISKNKIKE